jgi:hypothetical protein
VVLPVFPEYPAAQYFPHLSEHHYFDLFFALHHHLIIKQPLKSLICKVGKKISLFALKIA